MIIDFHTHCFPDAIAEGAMKRLSAAGNDLPYYTDGTAGGLKASMRAAGIDVSVIQHIATRPAQTPSVNRWAAAVNGGELVSFGTIHPDYADWRDEIRFLADASFKGIKFHPDYQDFTVDEKRLYPIYEAAANAGFILLFHAGLDLGFPPPYKCMPERLAKVLKDFPGLTIVAAHMGGYSYWQDVEEHLAGKDLYLDTSYCLVGMTPERLRGLIRAHGVSRALFGTDSPWLDQKAEVGKIRALGLLPEDTEAVLGGNAKQLLGL